MRSGRTEQVGGRVPFGAQLVAASSQSARGAESPAELTHSKVDHGPDGRTRPEIVRGDPEISAVSGRSSTTSTMQGTRLRPPIPWWLAVTSHTARVHWRRATLQD